ncbi:Protein of unknown function DUF58 [Acididesulfobacillus acetoxydans]|uniref:DUF58 domain-containing protein n=1 Tax=Acididesulfobacillus acetoxydans TaxID=1561005 RepID=A0A8S0XWE9_9FIRM|nr:DUF58 domain-containing protein [Acididesulfobacillus acetoxydans]CAA7600987.1 Protein of unknown function DUF58 [Acididesulfobacillus acetoxydans]CEJ07710.1 Protein of unknown function DUF58 [Acididesulfobacillus acetoxydans]
MTSTLRRSALFLFFLVGLFVYAHSEGDRLPAFLFIAFTSLWLTEFLAFLWFRLRTRATWFLSATTEEAYSDLSLTLLTRYPPFGTLGFCLTLPWKPAGHADRTLSFNPEPGVEQTFSFLLGNRGRYEIGPLSLTFQDPLGLFTLTGRIGKPQEIWVTPRLLPIAGERYSGFDPWAGDLSNRGQPSGGARNYEFGDPWQHIHWKATARTQKLMVREFEAESDTDALLWLDLASSSYEGNEAALETAVSLAASFLTHFARQHRPLLFLATAYVPWSHPLTESNLPEALRFLAGARADGISSAEEGTDGLPPTSKLLVITGRVKTPLLQKLSRRDIRGQRIVFATGPVEEVSPAITGVEVRPYQTA